MLTIVTAAFLATSATLAPAAPPTVPDRVVIEVVQVNGSGCRPHTAVPAIAPDRTAFTVTYSEYIAQVGPGAKPKDAHKDCRLKVRLDIPAGFTYTITHADYRGFALLERGASGMQRARYQYQTQKPGSYADHPISSPYEDNWQVTDTATAQDWAPCGKSRKLDIETELVVNVGSSDPDAVSVLTMDSTDGSVDTTYHFSWRRC